MTEAVRQLNNTRGKNGMVNADAPLKYVERTRHYYRALGYTRDYVWATFDTVPFTDSLSHSRNCGLR